MLRNLTLLAQNVFAVETIGEKHISQSIHQEIRDAEPKNLDYVLNLLSVLQPGSS